jgi:hypothetical protein
MRAVFDTSPRIATVALQVNRPQTPNFQRKSELNFSVPREVGQGKYLHESLCRREATRPEEMGSDDMPQSTLGILRRKERVIRRQRCRKPLSLNARQLMSN